MKTVHQIRAIHNHLVARLHANAQDDIIRELALDIHQALHDAVTSGDVDLGVLTLCGPQEDVK